MHAHFLGMHVFLYKYDSFIVAIVHNMYDVHVCVVLVRLQGKDGEGERERHRYRERLELKSYNMHLSV